MKRIVIISDSYKGTLSSSRVGTIIDEELKKIYPQLTSEVITVADGGEGTVDAILAAVEGEKVTLEVTGPLFKPVSSFYGLIDKGRTAIIEMAACAGIGLVGNNKNPLLTTTYGVGELISDALDRGVKKIIVGLGGSSTNDGGCGMAAALGVKFFDENEHEFIPVGGTLEKIARIDITNVRKELSTIELLTMCDIDNPLYGSEGAAFVFGPQKGASEEMVLFLDDNLKHLAKIVSDDLDFTEWDFKGAGAAGGLGFGMKVFLDAKIAMGIEIVLDIIDFENLIKNVDLIITGEGKLDYQSMRGKVVIGVARRARKLQKKVYAIVGSVGVGYEEAKEHGVEKIIIVNRDKRPFSEIKLSAENDLRKTIQKFFNPEK